MSMTIIGEPQYLQMKTGRLAVLTSHKRCPRLADGTLDVGLVALPQPTVTRDNALAP
jgi:hypothetical protein